MQAVKTWSKAGREIILTNFFFWAAGTDVQKSQLRLLRSLLYEILRQCPRLIPLVCSSYSISSLHWIPDSWSLSDLEKSVNEIQHQQSLAVDFTFFIDGLDEYDGEYNDLVELLQRLTMHPNIKICASSRPYYFFKDAFGQDSTRHLTLEEFTGDDIRRYVELSFGRSPRY